MNAFQIQRLPLTKCQINFQCTNPKAIRNAIFIRHHVKCTYSNKSIIDLTSKNNLLFKQNAHMTLSIRFTKSGVKKMCMRRYKKKIVITHETLSLNQQ